MNIYVINFLFFGFSAFLISILILLKRGDELARRWFYFSIFVTIYALSYAFVYNPSVSNEEALFYSRVATAAAGFIPGTWLYFTCGFLNVSKRRLFRVIWSMAWFVMLASLLRGDLVIPSVSRIKSFVHFPEAGPILHFQTIHFFLVVAYGFFLMATSFLKESSSDRKNEVLLLFIATVLGFIGGGSQFSLIYLKNKGLDLTLLIASYPFLMAYAMVKHRVLDIEKLADAFQREKLAAIGVLTAGLNHEIKNPLYLIKGKAESFVSNWKDRVYQSEDPKRILEKAVEIFEGISEQADRIYAISKNILDFSKPSGNSDVAETRLEEITERTLSVLCHQLKLDRIQVKKKIPSSLSPIRANPRQLEEILFNLILNASQAMKEGGTIEVKAEQNNGHLNITVEDNGPGVSSDQLLRIFEPFYTTKESGTGLGLYITKQLVERNHGRISVTSKVNQGTRFVLQFRVAEKSPVGLGTV